VLFGHRFERRAQPRRREHRWVDLAGHVAQFLEHGMQFGLDFQAFT
jgi:hypothetical protein